MQYQNKEELIKIIKNNGIFLREVTGELRKDEDVVIAALQSTSCALQYVDKSLVDNEHFILRAINETHWALFAYNLASERVKKLEEVVKAAVAQDGEVVAYAGRDFYNRKDLAVLALNAKRNASLDRFGKELKNDKEFMFEVVCNYPKQIRCLGEELKNNIPFLAELVLAKPDIMKYLGLKRGQEVEKYIDTQVSTAEPSAF